MAKAARNVVLSPSRDIPFNKLVLSQSNVRRIQAGVSAGGLTRRMAHADLLARAVDLPVNAASMMAAE